MELLSVIRIVLATLTILQSRRATNFVLWILDLVGLLVAFVYNSVTSFVAFVYISVTSLVASVFNRVGSCSRSRPLIAELMALWWLVIEVMVLDERLDMTRSVASALGEPVTPRHVLALSLAAVYCSFLSFMLWNKRRAPSPRSHR
jgi:hypothetical protein